MIIGEYSAVAILAENVRAEMEGRYTIIGTIHENMHVPSFPTTLPFGMLIRIEPVPPKNIPLHIKVVGGDTTYLDSTIESPGPSEDSEAPSISIAGSTILNIQNPERVEVFLAIDGLEPMRVGLVKIEKMLPAETE